MFFRFNELGFVKILQDSKVFGISKLLKFRQTAAGEHPQKQSQNGHNTVKRAKTALALGSNMGDSQAILEAAIATLAQTPGIFLEAKSNWYKTKALGPPQPDYLNGCVTLQVEMLPQELLENLLKIERQFGRVRQERWGPRTLDLDLLLYDDFIVDTPNLQIPHPEMRDRAFVLVPLAEIASDWVEPVSGRVIKELLKEVDCSGVHLLVGN
ncbi:2-amino-4-hydroxy-6-hydroxymethyldihydropteridine diphosphokinase [Nostoc paludosum FACHB-159]|uniref:2-amino-4-hydroxy-6-hydroxymethyldihydropteridine diphosphokinase n=1 Tax=Nostoc paludosum FACHB-159 TaxID=2692908 RepID=A0ABR8KG18_9NOSO|nr:2-amino-4-hydroxy-6-hydroxymethyldihydropteridine diphosphokinase [Nostoc sp. FACHB-857]MBD2681673.1 2-amino-4-hydroxy-6-hydroxymethyldihydropteridine diphosphokinase [Nostoc sp. FACHB-857]MBD2737823.1 2-amino-4-hydroxy-6-hydroxymethyldihydropteridine diphosphokinase [Nostoc paludosum FACHB-159]